MKAMAERSGFDALAAQLSDAERRALLERILQGANVSGEPLFAPDAMPLRRPPEEANRGEHLGFIARLVMFFRRLFSGLSVDELLVGDDLRDLARGIEARYPGLVDVRRELLLDGFAAQLRALRDAARFFQDMLARSVDREKGAFVAFLVSIEMPELHARLVSETDPFARSAEGPSLESVRQAVFAAWDRILLDLTDERRRILYTDLRSLVFMRRLSTFLFDRLLGAWKPSPTGVGLAAGFASVRELVLELGDLLFSMSAPPSLELLEALFVSAARDGMEEPGFDLAKAIASDVASGAAAIQGIRAFNSRIPLGTVLRLVSGNPDYLPRELPGGEDWFAIFKAFWKEKIEARLEAYREECRNRELAEEIKAFSGGKEVPAFSYVSREGKAGSPPLRHEFALSLLQAFSLGPFIHEFNRPLKIVLVDGEFYRKDNRVEFTDAYNVLLRLHESLGRFDESLGPEGDIGKIWDQVSSEIGALPIKARKLEAIRRGADDDAERLIREAAGALLSMARIMKGVLKGEAGGRYDSLQNLSSLDGRGNREFLRSLEAIRGSCERAVFLLSELSGLDLGRP